MKHETISRLKGSGRPQIFQLSDKKSLESILSEKTNNSNRKIRRKLSAETKKEFKRTTVQREIKNLGFKVTKPILKPLLEKRHLNLRLNFSMKYLFEGVSFWKNVIFSDESMFCTHNHASRQNYFKSPHEKPLIVQTKKFEERKIMVWGCFSYQDVEKLVFIDEKILSRYIPESSFKQTK